jgi:hypothetical protein
MGNPTLLALALAFLLTIPGYCFFSLSISRYRRGSPGFHSIARLILISFFLTLFLYTIIAFIFSGLGIAFQNIRWFWIAIGILFIFLLKKDYRLLSVAIKNSVTSRWCFATAVVAAGLFFMISIQGGVLDMLADGWWHMAYANRIQIENSILVSNHPLVGKPFSSPRIIYPPIWHTTLAIISSGSGLTLPTIWHSIAAPVSLFGLVAFYLLSQALTRSNKEAFLSALLFIFLVGGLNSYFRVSSWPANVAYVALYFLLSETFRLSDYLLNKPGCVRLHVFLDPISLISLIGLFFLGLLLLGLHGVETILFFVAIASYHTILCLVPSAKLERPLQTDKFLTFWLTLAVALAGGILATTILRGHFLDLLSRPRADAPYLNFIVPGILVIFLILFSSFRDRWTTEWPQKLNLIIRLALFASLFAFLFLIVDFSHLAALFAPDSHGRHVPRAFMDYFDNRVWLPWWDHQLRGAMLFSGIAGVLCAFFNLTRSADRGTLFLFSNCTVGILVLSSPYVFTFFSFLIPLGSTYRIHMLFFAPIAIAVFLFRTLSNDRQE